MNNSNFALEKMPVHLENSIKIELEEDYWKNPKYQKYRTQYIDKDNYRFLSYDYYIEKVILKKDKVNKYKLGIFDIGTEKTIYSGDINDQKFYCEILETFEESTTIKGVKNKFYDAVDKGEILPQFEQVFGISIDDFYADQVEKYKLKKLLYAYTKTKIFGEKINLHALFSKPSFENVDKTISEEKNKNGRSIAVLKNELSKEIPLDNVRMINYEIISSMNEWEKLIGLAVRYVIDRKSYDLSRLANFLEINVAEKLWKNNNEIYQNPNMKLFDTIYFKVLQHEYNSQKRDFLKINEDTIDKVTNLDIPKINTDEKMVKEQLLKSEIKTGANTLARYIGGMFNNENDAIIFVKDNAKNIEILWEYFKYSYESDNISKVPYRFIVASLYALREAELNDEEFVYTYYRAPESGKIKVLRRLNRNSKTEEVFYRLWAKKVYFIYLCILDRKEEARNWIRIEKAIDSISAFMLLYHNLDDFILCNNHIFSIVRRSFVPEEHAIYIWNRVADGIAEKTGYKCLLMHPNVSKLFKMLNVHMDFKPIIDGFCSFIEEATARNLTRKLPVHFFFNNSEDNEVYECFFFCKVHQDTKELEIFQFAEVDKDKKIYRLQQLGFKNMLVDNEDEAIENWPELSNYWDDGE